MKVEHKLIRRVSIDKFYELVTGQEDAFYQICMVLPDIIKKAVSKLGSAVIPHDTVIDELRSIAETQNTDNDNLAVALAVYMLGFSSYLGFRE